jgi:hypothetical protein
MSTIPVLRSVNPHRRLRNGAKDRGNKIQRPLRLLLERWIGRRARKMRKYSFLNGWDD